ncbi:unnamed protein product [Camellia sinensis]
MPHGQANKRRSTTSLSEANPIEVPAHMSTAPFPMDASAGLSPVNASPSLQTADIGEMKSWYDEKKSDGIFG